MPLGNAKKKKKTEDEKINGLGKKNLFETLFGLVSLSVDTEPEITASKLSVSSGI